MIPIIARVEFAKRLTQKWCVAIALLLLASNATTMYYILCTSNFERFDRPRKKIFSYPRGIDKGPIISSKILF